MLDECLQKESTTNLAMRVQMLLHLMEWYESHVNIM